MTRFRRLARWVDEYTTWALNPGPPLNRRSQRPRP